MKQTQLQRRPRESEMQSMEKAHQGRNCPGFIDLQVNGFLGVDFSGPDLTAADFRKACREVLSRGTAAFLPTVITSPVEVLCRNLELIAETAGEAEFRGHLLGIHLEGPFISRRPGGVGAHNADWVLEPSIKIFDDLQSAARGQIRMLTIAADATGAETLAQHASRQGVCISLGHQLATEADLQRLARAGATALTHLGNGLPAMLPRHPNPIWAGLAALIFGAGLILLAGLNPIKAYHALFMGAFSDIYGISSTLTKTTPLIFAGLAVALAFKGGYFNVGAEGQLYLGGLGATLVGLYVRGIPPIAHIPLAFAAGFIFGAFWSVIPGYLKARHDVNEIITCIFMYFIGLLLIEYMASGPLFEPGAPAAMSPEIAESAKLPIIIPDTDVHLGLIICLSLVLIMQFVFSKTTIGYQITATGLNPLACRYAGMKTVRDFIILSLVSGGLAGLAGASEIMGLKHKKFDIWGVQFHPESILTGEGKKILANFLRV